MYKIVLFRCYRLGHFTARKMAILFDMARLFPERHSKVIFPGAHSEFKQAMEQILEALTQETAHDDYLIRLTFFVHVDSEQNHQRFLEEGISILKTHFGRKQPPFSFVAIPAAGQCRLCCEAQFLSDESKNVNVRFDSSYGLPYLVISSPFADELVVGGLQSRVTGSMRAKTDDVFRQMDDILRRENMNAANLVRRWAYIGRGTDDSMEEQNYQAFNDVRAAWSGSDSFELGIPAVTAIGMNVPGLVVDFLAVRQKGDCIRKELVNLPQMNVHPYSKEVQADVQDVNRLKIASLGQALAYGSPGYPSIFISATTGVEGEETQARDVEQQTKAALEKLDLLVSYDNLREHGVVLEGAPGKYRMLRGYVKNAADLACVTDIVKTAHPNTPVLLLHSDGCRDDLLVEIEGEFGF